MTLTYVKSEERTSVAFIMVACLYLQMSHLMMQTSNNEHSGLHWFLCKVICYLMKLCRYLEIAPSPSLDNVRKHTVKSPQSKERMVRFPVSPCG